MSQRKRSILAILALTVCLAGGSIGVRAAGSGREAEEVTSARTQYTKTFRNADGTTTLRVSNNPLHYRGADGRWEEIVTDLEPAGNDRDPEGNAYGFRAVKNSFRTYLPKNAGGWIELRSGDASLSFRLAGAKNNRCRRNGPAVLAESAAEGADLQYTVRPGGLKEEIILRSRREVKPFTYMFRLKGLTMTETEPGEYEFRDAAGNAVFTLPRMFMYDAEGAVSEDIAVELKRSGNSGNYQLKVTPSREWLADPERVYPVVIDPTFVKVSTTEADTHALVYFYIPSAYPVGVQPTLHPSGKVALNQPSAMEGYIKPYPVKVWYKITFGSTASLNINIDNPFLRITACDPKAPIDPLLDNKRDPVLVYERFRNSTRNGSFQIEQDMGALVEIETGSQFTFPWHRWAINTSLELTYQNETMSPPPPVIHPLPPEISGPVTLSWDPVTIDPINPDAPSGTTTGGIKGYFIQRSTTPDFSTGDLGNVTYDVGNVSSYTIDDLTPGVTYYFRVHTQDMDDNPTTMEPWDPDSRPSGVRWSAVTATRCVPAVPGGPIAPLITGISPTGIPITESPYCTDNGSPLVRFTTNEPIPLFTKIACGVNHVVALGQGGSVWAWGQNNSQVPLFANEITYSQALPVQCLINGQPMVGFKSLAAGKDFAIALRNDGTVWAWGLNNEGQLGNNTRNNSASPVQVMAGGSPLTDVVSIAAGYDHCLALKENGTVWTWGNNNYGQLGNNSTADRLTAVQAKGFGNSGYLTGVRSIAAGDRHSLACLENGSVAAWGYNANGQLGIGNTTNARYPVRVTAVNNVAIDDVIQVDGGSQHTLALKSDGTVWACGKNTAGQLGDATTTRRTRMVQVKQSSGMMQGAVEIAAGFNHSLARMADGSIWAWGGNNSGQLGDGTIDNRVLPVRVQIEDGSCVEIEANGDQSYCLSDGAQTWLWGCRYGSDISGSTLTVNVTQPLCLSTEQVMAEVCAVQYPIKQTTQVLLDSWTTTVQSSDPSVQTDWNLPEGHYLIYVRTANNVGWSDWSPWKHLLVDTTPPVVRATTETPTAAGVNLFLSSNEPIVYDLYWGENPANLTRIGGSTEYEECRGKVVAATDDNAMEREHYYRFVCRDRAGNVTETETYRIMQMNRIQGVSYAAGDKPVYEMRLDYTSVPWADGYNIYRRNPDGTVARLTPTPITDTSFIDQTDLAAHGVYAYAYTSVNAAGEESEPQWGDARTDVEPGNLSPRVYVPNIAPEVSGLTGPTGVTVNQVCSVTLGPVRDVEGDLLMYKLHCLNTNGESEIPVDIDLYPSTPGQTITVTLPRGENVWRLACIEADQDIIDRKEVEAASGTVRIDLPPEDIVDTSQPWSGVVHITGIWVVQAGETLIIEAGTMIQVDPNCGLVVRGAVQADGTAGRIEFMLFEPLHPEDRWLGVILEGDGSSAFTNVKIGGAERGAACVGSGTYAFTGCEFSSNTVGLHCFAGATTVNNCQFTDNAIYGLKEDQNNDPSVTGCTFRDNKAGDYYDTELTIVTPAELNGLGENGGNS